MRPVESLCFLMIRNPQESFLTAALPTCRGQVRVTGMGQPPVENSLPEPLGGPASLRCADCGNSSTGSPRRRGSVATVPSGRVSDDGLHRPISCSFAWGILDVDDRHLRVRPAPWVIRKRPMLPAAARRPRVLSTARAGNGGSRPLCAQPWRPGSCGGKVGVQRAASITAQPRLRLACQSANWATSSRPTDCTRQSGSPQGRRNSAVVADAWLPPVAAWSSTRNPCHDVGGLAASKPARRRLECRRRHQEGMAEGVPLSAQCDPASVPTPSDAPRPSAVLRGVAHPADRASNTARLDFASLVVSGFQRAVVGGVNPSGQVVVSS